MTGLANLMLGGLVVISTPALLLTGSAPAYVDLDSRGGRHHVVGVLGIFAGAGVVAVDRNQSFVVRLRARIALTRAYYRHLAGTGTPYAWVLREAPGAALGIDALQHVVKSEWQRLTSHGDRKTPGSARPR